MLIHATARLTLTSESLNQALAGFVAYARQHLVLTDHSEVCISIGESGARLHQFVAPLLPADTKEFYVGMLRAGAPLTAAQFLELVSSAKPKNTHSRIILSSRGLPDPLRLFDALAAVVPPTGRGITLLLTLKGWRFAGEAVDADVDAMFSRFRHGARTISASLALRFPALSVKDPVVKATIAAASARAGVTFGKPTAAFAAAANLPHGAPAAPAATADVRLQSPTPESQLVVLQTFDEALARAAGQIGARPEDLASIPLLFSRSGGFDKRMTDVMAGKKESVNLPARLRTFMREQFSGYQADAADAEQVWFRKPVAPTLDLLLMFDKVHQWGLGKTFTVEFGVDFPNTPFGGMHTGMGGTRKNIFWMFHEGWEKQVWAYTSRAELETALGSCGELLHRVVPALEQHCRELLLPVPEALPATIEQRGALSARDAYNLVLPLARAWAADVELESVASVNLLTMGNPFGVESSLGADGRLRSAGSWGFKFLSKRLDRYCYYTVPHTGRIWWSFYPVLQGAIPKYSSVLDVDDDWLDSTAVAPRAFQELRDRLRGFEVNQVWLSLHDPKRYTGNFVWEARSISYGGAPGRQDIFVHIDHRSGEVIDVQER